MSFHRNMVCLCVCAFIDKCMCACMHVYVCACICMCMRISSLSRQAHLPTWKPNQACKYNTHETMCWPMQPTFNHETRQPQFHQFMDWKIQVSFYTMQKTTTKKVTSAITGEQVPRPNQSKYSNMLFRWRDHLKVLTDESNEHKIDWMFT